MNNICMFLQLYICVRNRWAFIRCKSIILLIYSCARTLKTQLGGELPFITAFIHLLILFIMGTFGDLVILDWFIVSKITPKFVIIPGTQEEDYKDFSHHYKGHAWAAIPMILICALVAAIISYL